MKTFNPAQEYSDAAYRLRQSGRAPHGYNDIVRVASDVLKDTNLTHRKAQKYGQESAPTFNAVMAAVVAQAVLGDAAVLQDAADAAGFSLVRKEENPASKGACIINEGMNANVVLSHLLKETVKALEDGALDEEECRIINKYVRLALSHLGALSNMVKPSPIKMEGAA